MRKDGAVLSQFLWSVSKNLRWRPSSEDLEGIAMQHMQHINSKLESVFMYLVNWKQRGGPEVVIKVNSISTFKSLIIVGNHLVSVVKFSWAGSFHSWTRWPKFHNRKQKKDDIEIRVYFDHKALSLFHPLNAKGTCRTPGSTNMSLKRNTDSMKSDRNKTFVVFNSQEYMYYLQNVLEFYIGLYKCLIIKCLQPNIGRPLIL